MRTPILQPGDEIVMNADSGTGLYHVGDHQTYKGKTGLDGLIVANHEGKESHTSYMEKHLQIRELGTATQGRNVWTILPCNTERQL